jgi:sugar fermentation stimulation protein A
LDLPPLTTGRILRRYQRFLADVLLPDGRTVTAHCPNTGSMRGCWAPGAPAQLSHSDDPRRKLPWTLERVDMGRGWVGVHTGRVNGVIAESLAAGGIPALSGYAAVRREIPLHLTGLPRGRLDIGLFQGSAADALVEVKNATLLQGEYVRFPDAVTTRGRKHLDLLVGALDAGWRCVMLFALNRPEGRCVAPARDIDAAYARRLGEAASAGVEMLAVRIRHEAASMRVAGTVPVCLGA